MKKLFTASLFTLVCAASINAQSLKPDIQPVFSNTMGVSSGMMFFPRHGYNSFYSNPASQLGATYERKVYDHFFISTGFYLWNDKAATTYPNGIRVAEYNNTRTEKPGDLQYRTAYKTIELVPEYRIYSRKHTDVVTFGAGASYTFGTNTYLKAIYGLGPDSRSLGGDVFIDYNSTSGNYYFGTVAKAAYSHFFFHNRVGIGAEARYQYYFGLNDGEFDFDANLKINF